MALEDTKAPEVAIHQTGLLYQLQQKFPGEGTYRLDQRQKGKGPSNEGSVQALTKTLRIMTRKTPGDEGSKIWIFSR